MKTLKTLKFAIVLVAIFSFSACELIEEPILDTETGQSHTDPEDMED